MDDQEFIKLSKEIYEKIYDAFEDYDPDLVEVDLHLDNISVEFSNGVKFVVNRQKPVKQIWLATKSKGYHFNFDTKTGKWMCDRTGKELFDIFEESVSEQLGEPFKF